MTMKIGSFDINPLNTTIEENKAKQIMWLMKRKQYKTIKYVDIAGQPLLHVRPDQTPCRPIAGVNS